MIKYGIDVSKHQGDIDWIRVKNSGKVEFAILRAGYGKLISQKDSKFDSYYAECVKNNIPVGVYWYSKLAGVGFYHLSAHRRRIFDSAHD